MQTNKEFAQENKDFRDACQRAGIEATKRQASRFRRKKGKAYTYKIQM